MAAPARVLLADDSMVVRAVIRGQLTGQDYQLAEAADGDEALASVRMSPPDVVLLDVEMPGKTGYEVLEAMQADDALSHIPVIFLSGRVTADDVARGLKLGAHDYLRKPVEPGELIARVTAALRTKELHDRLRRDNDHLREIAPIDSLTGALDIRGLQRALGELAASSRSAGTPLGGILLDVDGLERVNQQFGWEGGDLVLRAIAGRVTSGLAPDQLVGRCGPDEFLVLVPGQDAPSTAQLADDLRRTLTSAPHVLAGVPHAVDVSIGSAVTTDGDAAGLLASLQQAIVADKARHRDESTPVAPVPPPPPPPPPTAEPTPAASAPPAAPPPPPPPPAEEASAEDSRPWNPDDLMEKLRARSQH